MLPKDSLNSWDVIGEIPFATKANQGRRVLFEGDFISLLTWKALIMVQYLKFYKAILNLGQTPGSCFTLCN
jgi:hypothetical protein